jgi:hypothetical protein
LARAVFIGIATPARIPTLIIVEESSQKRGGNDNQVGYDAGKQVKGRKIHALVDSEGLPMRVVVHSAAIQDCDGAGLILGKGVGRARRNDGGPHRAATRPSLTPW